MTELGGIAIAAVVAALLVVLWCVGRSKPRVKRRANVGGFGWALLFLSSGRMPPPPPESQIEQEDREKKNRDSSRDYMS